MNLVACVNNDFGIGNANNLLVDNPIDKAYFKRLTYGKIVVFGSNTYLSLPRRPLAMRTNIVLSVKQSFDNTINVTSIPSLLDMLSAYDTDDVFVCGGQRVYEQLIDSCKTAYINKINSNVSATHYMPNLDKLPNWCLSSSIISDGIEFCVYNNVRA